LEEFALALDIFRDPWSLISIMHAFVSKAKKVALELKGV